MQTFTKVLGSLVLTFAMSGCLYSDKQMAGMLIAEYPLPDMLSLVEFKLSDNGKWEESDGYLIRQAKGGFIYSYTKKGSKSFEEKYFSLMPLGGAYYAMEGTGGGKFQYSFVHISEEGILRWEPNDEFMEPIISNKALQQNLGVINCDIDKMWCVVDSITTLKNVIAYIVNQDIPPNRMYKFG